MSIRRKPTSLSAIGCWFVVLSLLVPPILAQSTQQQLAAIFKDLKSPDPNVYESAVHALLEIRSSDAVPILKNALQDKDPNIRRPVVLALAQLLPPEDAAPILIGALRDNNVEVRSAAVYALQGMVWPTIAVPILTEALKDTDLGIRSSTVDALATFGSTADVVPALRYAIGNNTDPTIRDHAARALGDLGFRASAAVPDLIALLTDNARVDKGGYNFPLACGQQAYSKQPQTPADSSPSPRPDVLDCQGHLGSSGQQHTQPFIVRQFHRI